MLLSRKCLRYWLSWSKQITTERQEEQAHSSSVVSTYGVRDSDPHWMWLFFNIQQKIVKKLTTKLLVEGLNSIALTSAKGDILGGACSSPLISYSINLQQDDQLSNTQARRTNGQGASNPGAPCSPFSPLGPFLPFFPFSPCGYNGLDKTCFILLEKKIKKDWLKSLSFSF